MITTTFRLEPSSDQPSALQHAANAYAVAVNSTSFALDLMSPFHLTMMAWRLNRSMSKLWGIK